MIQLDDHIATLSHIVFSTDDVVEWGGVYQWLHISASIESVSLDTIKYNQSFGWCAPADEFDLARDKLLPIFATKLAIFNFVWGALESTIDIVKPPKNPDKSKRGKIRDTCFWLSSFNKSEPIPELLTQTTLFRALALQSIGYDRVEKRISATDEFGATGVGLYGVYELRNLFAHGSMEFPYPDGENLPVCAEIDLVDCATRIVLFSIQLLMLKHFPNPEDYEVFVTSVSGNLDGETNLSYALRVCHLEEKELVTLKFQM
ncbi:Uncharacterised protein [Shewanella baltica]|uniref:hypothetical protein n=1 Tax=Shewanella TaxID=22 RepID=UPI000F712306|nr:MULTISPECIES: hypothetical protein [Shewanella]WAL76765.1 hypothetical protein OX890_11295 [Shewanella sp. DAU305]VEF25874.1 Uncharacterised protein [Shewanella baltica]